MTMASYDGGGFDEWLRDSFRGDLSDDKMARMRALLEPHIESIEWRLADFDPETQSWRDYRNSMWYAIPDDVTAAVTAIADEPE